MNKHQQPFEPNRRTFLRAVAFSGGAGVLAGSGIGLAATAEESATAAQSESPQQESLGYHLTDHIREYYRKAAF